MVWFCAGLQAISYQVTRKAEADFEPSHTTETLIGYNECCVTEPSISNHLFVHKSLSAIVLCPPLLQLISNYNHCCLTQNQTLCRKVQI